MPFPSPLSVRRARPSPLRAADTAAPQQRRRLVTTVTVAACALVGAVTVTTTLRPTAAPAPAPVATAADAAPPGPAADAVTAPPGTRVQTVFAATPRGLRAGDVVDVIAAFDPDLVPGSEPSSRVARRARVVDVRAPDDRSSVAEVTLAVAVPEDARVAFAARYGDLTLSVAPADDDRVGEATELPDGVPDAPQDRARDLPGDPDAP